MNFAINAIKSGAKALMLDYFVLFIILLVYAGVVLDVLRYNHCFGNFIRMLPVMNCGLIKIILSEPKIIMYRDNKFSEELAMWQMTENPANGRLTRYVIVSTKLRGIKLNTAILHEIGHDILRYRKKLNFINDKERIREEKAAWKQAIKLSKKMNIPICTDAAQKWLKTYGAEYCALRNHKAKK